MAKVSVIIPTKKLDDYAMRCAGILADLPEVNETFFVTDDLCPGFPAAKRNWAMQRASGDIFAFIDSDAYPSQDWLKNALYWLQCYPAVCGPGVVPPDAPFSEHVADQVHKWVFCPYRVTPKRPQIVPWFPTFNLIVRKEVASQFDEYLTGEDDRFGLKIKEGIFYHPDILVYHNRRGIFRPLWKQFGTWALHKGAFQGMRFTAWVTMHKISFQGIALVAWITTVWIYGLNFVKGFIRRKPF